MGLNTDANPENARLKLDKIHYLHDLRGLLRKNDSQFQKKLAETINIVIIVDVMKNQIAPALRSFSVSKTMKGFSLVELLTCVAIIGIIAAMALPSLAGIIESSVSTKTRHQVKTIAQTYAAARAAGAEFSDATREGIVEALTTPGGVRGKGIFSAMTFRVSISPEEKTALLQCAMLLTRTLPDGSLGLECRP